MVLKPSPKVAQYAATKHALRALADSLREEVNKAGVRVTSVYPGRSAGAIRERLFKLENLPYKPKRLVKPHKDAEATFYCLNKPRNVELFDLHLTTLSDFLKMV